MNFHAPVRLPALVIALASAAIAPVAFAQTTPQTAEAKPAKMMDCPNGMMGGQGNMMGQNGMMGGQGDMPNQNGMMSPGMMKMMSMMQGMMTMMSAESGMMAPHVEGRVAALKAELKITDAQMPQWNHFADALRDVGKTMSGMHQEMMQSGMAKTLPERLARREKMLTTHLASVKGLEEALQPLYATFSDEQKKIADRLMIGPMGMM